MNTHAGKTQENKSQSGANDVSHKQSGGESTFLFADNRAEAIMQRKLQEMAENSLQVKQLMDFQQMANNHFVHPIQQEGLATENALQKKKSENSRQQVPSRITTTNIHPGAAVTPEIIQRVVTPKDLSQEYFAKAKDVAEKIKAFPHEEKNAEFSTKQKAFGAFCRTAESTVDQAEQKIDELKLEVEQAEGKLQEYNDDYKIMSESMVYIETDNPASYTYWQPKFAAFKSDPLTMEWAEIEVALSSASDFKSALNKLKDKHPQVVEERLRKEEEQRAAELAAQESAQAAAAAEEARKLVIIDFVSSHNPTQVFTQYRDELYASAVTIGPKYAGGTDPVTGVDEDGVSRYSRAYTFALDPEVGEVHIHWRPFGTKWKPVKWHFKKAGSEGLTGAAHQRNLSLSEVTSLGITAVAPEKLTADKIE